MMIRVLGAALVAVALSCSAVIYSKNQSIEELNDVVAISKADLKSAAKQIEQLNVSLEQQTTAVNNLLSEAEQRERLIAKHYESVQLLSLSNQQIETELIEVITNDESNTAWAYVDLPADVKRVFDHATAKTNSNSYQSGEGGPACSPDECLQTSSAERGY